VLKILPILVCDIRYLQSDHPRSVFRSHRNDRDIDVNERTSENACDAKEIVRRTRIMADGY